MRMTTIATLVRDLQIQFKEHQGQLTNTFRNLKATIANHSGRIKRIEDELDEAAKRFRDFDPVRTEKLLDNIRGRSAELSRRMQAHLLKETVLTEVSCHLRKNAPSDLPAVQEQITLWFDKDNEWWLDRKTYTIQTWVGKAIQWSKVK